MKKLYPRKSGLGFGAYVLSWIFFSTFIWLSEAAIAEELPLPPKLEITVSHAASSAVPPSPTFSAFPGLYSFDVSVNLSEEFTTFPIKGDLYLGVMLPGGGSTLTWSADSALQRGFVPILEDIDLGMPAHFSVSDLLGHAVEHSFTGAEPPGMYSVFALVVWAGADPTNNGNWISAVMQPLMVNVPAMISDNPSQSSSPAYQPQDIADAVVVFTAYEDIPLVTADVGNLLLVGEAASLSGPVPEVIQMSEEGFMGGMQAGVPVKLYLKQSQDGAFYYPVGMGAIR